MAGDPEATALETLLSMQMRLVDGPYVTLGIEANATESETRTAYLTLTKKFHPAKFSRMSVDMQKLSNEVFLGIKGAHDQLVKSNGWAARGVPNHARPPSPAPGAPPVAPPTSPRGTGPRATQPSAGDSQGMSRAPVAAAPSRAESTGTVRVAVAPPRTGGTGSVPALPRPSSPQPVAPTRPAASGPTAARPTTPGPAAPSATRPPPTSAAPTTTGAAGSGSTRNAPTTVQPWKPRAASPVPGSTGATKPPPTSAEPFDERAQILVIQDLIRKHQWGQARELLQTCAKRGTNATFYNARIAFVRGREAQDANRLDEAALEFKRALELEPGLTTAKSALAEVQRGKK